MFECPYVADVFCNLKQCEKCTLMAAAVEEESLLGYSHETTYTYDGEDILVAIGDVIIDETKTQEDKILEIMSIIAGLQGYMNEVEGA